MEDYWIQILPEGRKEKATGGERLLDVLLRMGIMVDAPCGGRGRCGKCSVLVNGHKMQACKALVDQDMKIELPDIHYIEEPESDIPASADGESRYAVAFDVGTTTIAGFLMDGVSGRLLSQTSMLNPQISYGADVISRIQYVLESRSSVLEWKIKEALADMTLKMAHEAGADAHEIMMASIVCNTAMHHLMLGIDPKPLTVPPYTSDALDAVECAAKGFLPISDSGRIRLLPNIAGFVGADTVGGLLAVRFDHFEEPVLLIDIGTNGEMVLGNGKERLACSTAAGPAFEGGNIKCGMRGTEGAIYKVSCKEGHLACDVLGNAPAKGICGSGLLDAVYMFLKTGIIDENGKMHPGNFDKGAWGIIEGKPVVYLSENVYITQKDIREVQLAKAAVRAGIEIMAERLRIKMSDIKKVYLAGAFGSHLSLESACGIGMIPPCLQSKIECIGNAAGKGARMCALSREKYEYSKELAAKTGFLELASIPDFQEIFIDALGFGEE